MDFTLTVTATATETVGGDTANTAGTIDVAVNAVADAPRLDLNPVATGDQLTGSALGAVNTAISLDVFAALTDADGSETLAIVVSAIPVGATLSDGMNSFAATSGITSVDVASWNLPALTITPPAGSGVDFSLTVTATSTESANSDTESTAGTIDVTVVPAVTATWTNDDPLNNLWQSPDNWDIDLVPPVGASILIPMATGPTVHNAATGTTSVSSLTASDLLTVSGGTLILGAASTVDANGTLDLTGGVLQVSGGLSVGGQFTLNGGTVRGGLLSLTGTTTVTSNPFSRLNGVILDGALDLSASSAFVGVINNLTGVGVSETVITLSGNAAALRFSGTQTFDNATVVFSPSGGGGNPRQIQVAGAGSILTLGPNLVVEGGFGQLRSIFSGLEIINQGTISANLSGQAITINPSNFTNTATLEATGGGILSLGGFWDNDGVIQLDAGSFLGLGGAFTTADIGTIVRPPSGDRGTITLSGVLDNSGDILTIDAASGSWTVFGGDILRGTIVLRDGEQLDYTSNSGNLLDGVELDGALDLSASSAFVGVINNLTGVGVSETAITLSGNAAALRFSGTQTFDNATVVFSPSGGGGNPRQIQVAGAGSILTLGPNLVVEGGFGQLRSIFSGLEIINQGTISANLSGQAITINPSNFTNTATLEATGGGILSLGGFWDNDGVIQLDAGSFLGLGGAFTTADIGTIVRPPSGDRGTITLSGVLDNSGDILTIDAASGSWTVFGGDILRGTIVLRDGEQLDYTSNSGNLLDGVELDGALDLSASSAFVGVINNLTGVGVSETAITLSGNAAALRFSGTQTFDNATVVFSPSGGGGNPRQIQVAGAGSILTTLGPEPGGRRRVRAAEEHLLGPRDHQPGNDLGEPLGPGDHHQPEQLHQYRHTRGDRRRHPVAGRLLGQ